MSGARDVGRGDMFGEESLLEEEDINGPGLRAVRQATACCLRDSELVKIMPQNMAHIAQACPTPERSGSAPGLRAENNPRGAQASPMAGIKLLRSIANRHLHDRSVEQNLLIQGRSRTANLSTIAVVPLGYLKHIPNKKMTQILRTIPV
jgi:CRP-like cAMP-binding protein